MKFLTYLCLTVMSTMSTVASCALLDRLEASVNGSTILLSDVRKYRQTLSLRAQLDPLFAGTPLAASGSKATDLEITNYLIQERLIAQQFPVTDAEAEQEVNTIQVTNKLDRKALKSALSSQGFQFEDYFELIRISASKRNLIDRDIRARVTLTDDDLKNHFYNTIAKGSATPLSYSVKIISVNPSNYKSAQVARDFLIQSKKRIEQGESFEDVAKQMSDDASAATGGDLGVLNSDTISPKIKNVLKILKIGQISDVFGDEKTNFFILKLIDVKSTESERFESMKEEIRNQLASTEYQYQINLWIERQKQSAFIHSLYGSQ